ncbi:hypothetical protein OC834_003911 [Tilletia horrida]|uniref:Asl1-like glycosyl hydrolase catalytic domain-containing protein n=1 Tax=Tilletia horrida TaxID=155126 RepID=A0AAN6GEG2_9BASI|nr:hypothetical protein OC835_006766 [Tilletia horrida]KAK0528831.1 hypothetical protein OC834_003911 [Tilletia horrida]KAK0532692.1 hypothetical protein OC842_003209 [Tilletia horrida]KAK0548145.1 hypothetical protein OC844_007060 [Tilletia horrida]
MQVAAAFQRLSLGLLLVVAALALLSKPASAVQAGVPWGTNPELARKLVRGNSRIRWHWNWGNNRPTPTLRHINYVPTLWGPGKVHSWHSLERWYKKRGKRPKYILAQNEPDIRTQSNMTPKQAAKMWMKELHPWQKRGSKVSSAQICWDTSKWLDPFLRHLRNMGGKPNFCAAHYYGSPTDLGRFKRYVRRVRSTCRKHGIKNVWLTEIGVMASSRPTQAQTNHFAKQVFRWLDTQPYVKRAAWIGAFRYSEPYDGFMSQKNAFFNSDGSLRALGHLMAFGNLHGRSLDRLPAHSRAADAVSENVNGTYFDALAPLDDPRGQTDLTPDDDEHDPNDDAYWDAKFAKEDAEDPNEDGDVDLVPADDDDDDFTDGFLGQLSETDDGELPEEPIEDDDDEE